jgi:hypothetical protein
MPSSVRETSSEGARDDLVSCSHRAVLRDDQDDTQNGSLDETSVRRALPPRERVHLVCANLDVSSDETSAAIRPPLVVLRLSQSRLEQPPARIHLPGRGRDGCVDDVGSGLDPEEE